MKYFLAVVAGLVLLLIGAGYYFQGTMYPLEIAGSLLFGWAQFLLRVIPEMRLTVAGSIAAALCMTLIAIGLHHLCGWFYRYNQKANATASEVPQPRWHWRWTMAVLGVVMLMFVAGVAAVGVTHQASWLATSPEPLIGPSETGWRKTEAVNQLRYGPGIWTLTYVDNYKKLPLGGTFDEKGNGLHSWQTLILSPNRDSSAIDMKLPWNHPKNAPVFKNVIREYHYPGSEMTHDTDGFAVSHYASNVHVIGGSKSISLKDIPNGGQNTLLIGQVADNFQPWGKPGNWRDPALGINKSPNGFGNQGRTGALFVFADGHVKFLTNDTSSQVLKTLSTPNAGD